MSTMNYGKQVGKSTIGSEVRKRTSLSVAELAEKMGIEERKLRKVFLGDAPLTRHICAGLVKYVGGSKRQWTRIDEDCHGIRGF